MPEKKNILLVEDEPLNIDIIKRYLRSHPYKLTIAENGEEALRCIEDAGRSFDVILLDRMLPDMDGIHILEVIKSDADMQYIPVVFQTARANHEEVASGIKAGAYYYLTKPYDEDVFISVVNAAANIAAQQKEMFSKAKLCPELYGIIDECSFRVRTLEDMDAVVPLISSLFPDVKAVFLGVSELILNAIEHGNLEIGYEGKSELNLKGTWKQEILRRLALPENRDKYVEISYSRGVEKAQLAIKDRGKGFRWQDFMDIDPVRAVDNHGRGIAMANAIGFDNMEYNEPGNEVYCTVYLNKYEAPAQLTQKAV